jgi:hypothetical protein
MTQPPIPFDSITLQAIHSTPSSTYFSTCVVAEKKIQRVDRRRILTKRAPAHLFFVVPAAVYKRESSKTTANLSLYKIGPTPPFCPSLPSPSHPATLQKCIPKPIKNAILESDHHHSSTTESYGSQGPTQAKPHHEKSSPCSSIAFLTFNSRVVFHLSNLLN